MFSASSPDATQQQRAEGKRMNTPHIEITCLECHSCRRVKGLGYEQLGSCLNCGYVGWALAEEMETADPRVTRTLGFAFA